MGEWKDSSDVLPEFGKAVEVRWLSEPGQPAHLMELGKYGDYVYWDHKLGAGGLEGSQWREIECSHCRELEAIIETLRADNTELGRQRDIARADATALRVRVQELRARLYKDVSNE